MSYDAVVRLTLASEYRGDNGAHVWSADYNFDRYNNRQRTSSGSTYNMTYVPVAAADIVATTNRFISTGSTPMTYDAAGNSTSDGKEHSYPEQPLWLLNPSSCCPQILMIDLWERLRRKGFGRFTSKPRMAGGFE